MKALYIQSICWLLICISLTACFKPFDIDREDYPGNHSRWVGPEGRDIQFFNDYVFANDPEQPSDLLVNLTIPPRALGDTIFIEIIKGDLFATDDLVFHEHPTIDPFVFPMYTGRFDSVLWEWRAIVGFLPNLQVLSRTAQLSFAFEDPHMNIYPNLNLPEVPYFFHYSSPKLYQLEIHPDINPFIESSRVLSYLLENRDLWEEVKHYELDDDVHEVRLEIDNFHNLYFLAGERWTLQRDDSLTMTLDGSYLGNLEIENKGLVEILHWGRTNDEAFNRLVEQSVLGLMYQNERSTYHYFGTFSGNLLGPFASNIDRIGLSFSFDGDEEGTYDNHSASVKLYWVEETEVLIRLLDVYSSNSERDLNIQIDSYGEIGEKVQGRITARLESQKFSSRQIDIDIPFEIMRTK